MPMTCPIRELSSCDRQVLEHILSSSQLANGAGVIYTNRRSFPRSLRWFAMCGYSIES